MSRRTGTTMKHLSTLCACTVLLPLLSACAIGPDYKKPDAPVPPAYKELKGWKIGTPKQAASDASWWAIYNDPVLDGLEKQVNISNQNLKAAEAAYREAAATVDVARASFFPTVSVTASGTRSGEGSGSTSSTSLNGGRVRIAEKPAIQTEEMRHDDGKYRKIDSYAFA